MILYNPTSFFPSRCPRVNLRHPHTRPHVERRSCLARYFFPRPPYRPPVSRLLSPSTSPLLFLPSSPPPLPHTLCRSLHEPGFTSWMSLLPPRPPRCVPSPLSLPLCAADPRPHYRHKHGSSRLHWRIPSLAPPLAHLGARWRGNGRRGNK